jgi:hypothetical protein
LGCALLRFLEVRVLLQVVLGARAAEEVQDRLRVLGFRHRERSRLILLFILLTLFGGIEPRAGYPSDLRQWDVERQLVYARMSERAVLRDSLAMKLVLIDYSKEKKWGCRLGELVAIDRERVRNYLPRTLDALMALLPNNCRFGGLVNLVESVLRRDSRAHLPSHAVPDVLQGQVDDHDRRIVAGGFKTDRVHDEPCSFVSDYRVARSDERARSYEKTAPSDNGTALRPSSPDPGPRPPWWPYGLGLLCVLLGPFVLESARNYFNCDANTKGLLAIALTLVIAHSAVSLLMFRQPFIFLDILRSLIGGW